MKNLHMVAMVVLVLGGLNWLLIGLFEYDLVAAVLGESSVLSKLVYVLVGLSALVVLWDMISRRHTAATPATV